MWCGGLTGADGCATVEMNGVIGIDVDLDLSFRTRGRATVPVVATAVREVTEADLALLATEKGVRAPAVQRLRDSHHMVARLLAEGQRPESVIAATGYSASRISILQADPAFQELVAFYRKEVDTAFADLQDRMASLALDVAAEIQDRLNDEPEEINTTQLMALLSLTADRTGHGVSTKSTNVNVNVNLGERLRAARERAASPLLPLPGPKPIQAPAPIIEGEVISRGPTDD